MPREDRKYLVEDDDAEIYELLSWDLPGWRKQRKLLPRLTCRKRDRLQIR